MRLPQGRPATALLELQGWLPQPLRRSSWLGPENRRPGPGPRSGPRPEPRASCDAVGCSAATTAPTTSRNATQGLSLDVLNAVAASAFPVPIGQAARRYAHTCSPGRPAV